MGLGTPDLLSAEETLVARVDTCRTVADVRNIVHQLRIDLMRQPECSRLIFGRLLARSDIGQVSTEELLTFLDDPFLNIRGAGNYQSVAEHLVSSAADRPGRQALLDTIVRALELGLIPPGELCDIVRTVSDLPARSLAVGAEEMGSALLVYRQMWDAIGRCDIYRHKDLDSPIVDAWLGALEDETACDSFGLAKDIIVATQRPDFDCPWVVGFITRELELHTGSNVPSDETHGVKILQHFVPEVASEYIIGVTESLVSSKRADLLERWQDCLLQLDDVSALVKTQRWLGVQKQPVAAPGLSPQHQIILRLWLLRTLSRNLPEGPLWRRAPRATDAPACDLFNLYQSIGKIPTKDLLHTLMRGIHELGLPSNGLLLMASQLRFQKTLTPTARRTLKAMESPPVSFAEIFADVHAYNAVAPHFFSALQEAVQQIDITDPSFISHSIELARTGNSHSVWTLLRIFRSHTPLKIALAMSWGIAPPTPDTAPSHPRTTSSCPNPHAALHMINSLAVSISCSEQFSPRCAYKLVHWLYVFLVRHEAPVQPALVRAMYHAGVMRFRREGHRVSATQYAYIMALVRDTEGADVVAELMSPQVGRSGLVDDEFTG